MARKARYVDVDVFVYWLGGHPVYGEVARKWIRAIERAQTHEFVTCTLSVYETLVALASLTGNDLRDRSFAEGVIKAFEELRGLRLEPLTLRDVVNAPLLMEKYGLDYEDAIHLAVALRVGAVEVISSDVDWDRGPLPRKF